MTALFFAPFFATAGLEAQAAPPDLPIPDVTGKVGAKDSAAIQTLAALIETAGASNWRDLHATGQMTNPTGESNAFDLLLENGGYTRLDITYADGVSSTRLSRCSGKIVTERGATLTLPPASACAGILAFPRLWKDAANSAHLSLRDMGNVSVNGEQLRRLSMEYTDESGRLPYGRQTTATDVYIDVATHQLVYSVDEIALPNSHDHYFKRITSYSNYKQFSGITVPVSISQWLDGQLQWNMQMQDVQINTSPDPSSFRF